MTVQPKNSINWSCFSAVRRRWRDRKLAGFSYLEESLYRGIPCDCQGKIIDLCPRAHYLHPSALEPIGWDL